MTLYIHFKHLKKFDTLYRKDLYLQQIVERNTGIKWNIKVNDEKYLKAVLNDIEHDIA